MDCAADLGYGLACKGRCEERVRWFNQQPEAYAQEVDKLRRSTFRAAKAGIGLGMILLYYSVYAFMRLDDILFAEMLGGGGICSIAFAVLRLRANYPECPIARGQPKAEAVTSPANAQPTLR
jgi:hypothetical protein